MYIKFSGKIEENAGEYAKILNAIIDKEEAYFYPRLGNKGDKTGFTLQAVSKPYADNNDLFAAPALVLFHVNSKVGVPNFLEAGGMGRFNGIFDAACNAVGFFAAMGIPSYFGSLSSKTRSNAVLSDPLQIFAMEYDIYTLAEMSNIKIPILRA